MGENRGCVERHTRLHSYCYLEEEAVFLHYNSVSGDSDYFELIIRVDASAGSSLEVKRKAGWSCRALLTREEHRTFKRLI